MSNKPLSPSFRTLTAAATSRRASTSRPESISSRMDISLSMTASWRISLRFFSPPLKPSLTFLAKNDGSMFSCSSFGVRKP